MIFLWFKGSSGRIIQISLTNLTKILNSYEVIKRVLYIGQDVVWLLLHLKLAHAIIFASSE